MYLMFLFLGYKVSMFGRDNAELEQPCLFSAVFRVLAAEGGRLTAVVRG